MSTSDGSSIPWHGYILGNATLPLLYFFSAFVLFCTLSGKWWLMGYLFAFLVIYAVVLLYALYLEHDAQTELERRAKLMRMAQGPGPRPRKTS